jgi:hypothetical protein
VIYAIKSRLTLAAGSACAVVATGPAVVSTEVWLLKADIAGGAVVTFAALPAITGTGDAHVGVGVALQTFGAGAEWSALFGALFKAIMGATVGSTFFSEATCGGDAFLDAKAIFAGQRIHTDAAHTAAAVVPTLLAGAIRLTDLADIDLRVITHGVGIHIALPADGANATRAAGHALS